ncbi:MAG: hypothetical protein MJ196_10140 [Treponemataceae bacterium]|nr:hypothetical protein [Treponemataceae bacterium]
MEVNKEFSTAQNTNVPIVKDMKVEDAIKYFGLEGFPLPKEIEEHIVDLASLEKMLDEINSHYEATMKKIGNVTGGVINSLWEGASSFSNAAGEFTSALSFGSEIGKVFGNVVGGIAGGIVAAAGSVVAGAVGGVIGLGPSVVYGVKANKAADERYKVAEAKIDNIKAVIPTLNKPGYRLMYEQEMKKTVSLSDINREKREQEFRFSLFLYAKTEYLKKLAEYFVDTFEAWLKYKEKGSLEAPVFINDVDKIVNSWELAKTLVGIQNDVMPLYLVVALKDPFIASRYINMDSKTNSEVIGYDINNNKGFVYLGNCHTRYELPNSACSTLSENPLYINYKKMQTEYPKVPKKVTFIDVFLYLLIIAVFVLVIYFLPANIPLNIASGSKKFGFVVICIGFCLLTPWIVSFFPVTKRFKEYDSMYKEHYEKIQDTFRKAEKEPASLITVNRR